jgi:hypothetical protein
MSDELLLLQGLVEQLSRLNDNIEEYNDIMRTDIEIIEKINLEDIEFEGKSN